MSNARFSVLQARAVEDKRISNAQFRTLAALGLFGDKDGWCFPKLKTLATILGKSKQAVNHDLLELQELGYVEIHHQYREDGGLQHNRYRLVFDPPYQGDVDTPKDDVDTLSIPEIDTPSISEVDSLSISEVDALTPHINAPINAPLEQEQPARPNLYGVYEQEISGLTPMICEMLDDWEKTYPAGWPEEAIREAKKSTTRVNPKYVEAILKRWLAQGRTDNREKTKPATPAKQYEPVMVNGEMQFREVTV